MMASNQCWQRRVARRALGREAAETRARRLIVAMRVHVHVGMLGAWRGAVGHVDGVDGVPGGPLGMEGGTDGTGAAGGALKSKWFSMALLLLSKSGSAEM